MSNCDMEMTWQFEKYDVDHFICSLHGVEWKTDKYDVEFSCACIVLKKLDKYDVKLVLQWKINKYVKLQIV